MSVHIRSRSTCRSTPPVLLCLFAITPRSKATADSHDTGCTLDVPGAEMLEKQPIQHSDHPREAATHGRCSEAEHHAYT